MGTLHLITGPTSEPVTAAEAKLHLRVDQAADDTLIGNLIEAARETVERELNGRVLMPQSWEYTLDRMPVGAIEIPMADITAIGSVKYIDPGGVQQTWDPALYRVDLRSEPVRITPEYLLIYPLTRFVINTVTVAFTAGYPNAAAVPYAIKQAMLLLIGSWYENRQEGPKALSGNPVKTAVDALLSRYRLTIP